MIRFGLRFDRRDATHLAGLALRVKAGEMTGERVGGFIHAAEAAETGEPLIIQCMTADEAEQMAARFVALGVRRPAVEELTGQRPAK